MACACRDATHERGKSEKVKIVNLRLSRTDAVKEKLRDKETNNRRREGIRCCDMISFSMFEAWKME